MPFVEGESKVACTAQHSCIFGSGKATLTREQKKKKMNHFTTHIYLCSVLALRCVQRACLPCGAPALPHTQGLLPEQEKDRHFGYPASQRAPPRGLALKIFLTESKRLFLFLPFFPSFSLLSEIGAEKIPK